MMTEQELELLLNKIGVTMNLSDAFNLLENNDKLKIYIDKIPKKIRGQKLAIWNH